MKTGIVCIAWLLMIFPFGVSGQIILAGQSSGNGIVYHDIDDLHIESPSWNTYDEEFIDLNDDGAYDLRLMTNFVYYSHPEIMEAYAAANAQGNCQYSTLAEDSAWIRQHAAGEPIDNSLSWWAETDPYYGIFKETSGPGNFSDGYMAYRICGSDTSYGWIRLSCNVSLSGAYLTVHEFAYKTIHLGIPGNNRSKSSPSFFIQSGQLMVEIPETIFNASGRVSCFDLSGRLILKQELQPGLNRFILPAGYKGLIIIRYDDGNGRVYPGKLTAL